MHMKVGSIRRIGVLVEITRAFGRDVCAGIAEFAREREDVEAVFVGAETLGKPARLSSFDGFIARVMNERIARALTATGRPVVDIYYERPYPGFAVVKTNHARIGRLAAEHFIERRFTNFAFCGFAGGRFSDYCRQAFQRALKSRGFGCQTYEPIASARYGFDASVLINERLDRAPDEKRLADWLTRLPKPIAVFCPNDLRAWQLLQVAQGLSLRVPQDVAILGLDNDVLVCGFSRPMLSSIDPDSQQIGREAAKTLLEMLERPALRKHPPIRQIQPRRVVERASTEVYPIDPPWMSDALSFIRRHVADGISAADVFARVGLSHTAVDAMFREKLGSSVQREIARFRLEEARRLLAETSLDAAEIARRAGFSSAAYFTRAFTAANGVSPLTWRRRQNA